VSQLIILIIHKLKSELILLQQHKIGCTIPDIVSWFQVVYVHVVTVYEAVSTFLVLPTTNASLKDLFRTACMRRIKTYLRSSMGQELRLNSMNIDAAHPDLLDCIDVCSEGRGGEVR